MLACVAGEGACDDGAHIVAEGPVARDGHHHVGAEEDGVAHADALVHLLLGVPSHRRLHLRQDRVAEGESDDACRHQTCVMQTQNLL